ncbi:MAG: MBL fold metallo-hydrolase [Gemmatimonadaceae bacterium]
MNDSRLRITYIGGPTAIIEWRGLRLLTDPTFDPGGTSYALPEYTLRKTSGPALPPDAVGRIDAVLLSHDHHRDNLDDGGRALVRRAPRVLTTVAGAKRLGGGAVGMVPWQTDAIGAFDGAVLRVTATPARHGPAQGDRGPVIGFALTFEDTPRTVYVSGDTVWFDGVREVGERFDVRTAVLSAGAARVAAAGHFPLTFTAAETVTVARTFPRATIVPLHCEGWEHFSESCLDVREAFRAAKIEHRLLWLVAGKPTDVSLDDAPAGG